MVARVEGPGGLLGLHLTLLEPDGRGRKEKRLAKGSKPRGGAIHLFPLEEGQPLVLAEGIETALAVREVTGWPVWATIAAPFMREVVLPPEVKEVVVAADHDPAGIDAAKSLARKLLQEGRRVRMAVPPEEGEDWLDTLTRLGHEEVGGLLQGSPEVGEESNARVTLLKNGFSPSWTAKTFWRVGTPKTPKSPGDLGVLTPFRSPPPLLNPVPSLSQKPDLGVWESGSKKPPRLHFPTPRLRGRR